MLGGSVVVASLVADTDSLLAAAVAHISDVQDFAWANSALPVQDMPMVQPCLLHALASGSLAHCLVPGTGDFLGSNRNCELLDRKDSEGPRRPPHYFQQGGSCPSKTDSQGAQCRCRWQGRWRCKLYWSPVKGFRYYFCPVAEDGS